ncbi:unnamed protein product [Diamesa tonsa]
MRINSILCISIWLIVNISGLNAATCSYSISSDDYSCVLSDVKIINGILKIYGDHVSGKGDSDVTSIVTRGLIPSSIVSVPADIFNKFINLMALQCVAVEIETISKSSFINCDKLDLLNLENNKISVIPNEVFEKCINLGWISLKSNLITTIESAAFSGLSQLKLLDIKNNKITQLDFKVDGFNQLRYLDFSNNEVSAVQTDFQSNLKNIEYLNGESNVCINDKYEHFPVTESQKTMFDTCYKNFQDVIKKKTISCKYYLDKAYGYSTVLSNMYTLSDTDDLITSGTHLFGKSDQSVSLVLVINSNFISIPDQVFIKYPAMTYFSSSDAGITTLNEKSFKNAKNLKIIWLNKNKITELPAFVFKETPKLEQLMLSQNQISEINVDAFSGTSRLLRLDMSNNKLKTLQSGLFKSLTNLQILMLANNEIQHIDNDAFNGLINLRYLNLDGSKIVDLAEEWFTTTSKLQTIRLQNNQINTIGKNALSKLRFLKELNLENNICVSKKFENIKTADADVIPNIPTCITNFNTVYDVKECSYVQINYNFLGYKCEISNLLRDDGFKIGGTHLLGKNDDDVKSIIVIKSQLFRVPKIFFDKFKNLEILDVSEVGMKIIDGSTFQSCGKLQYFYARKNEIAILTAGAFASCLELHSVYLESNKINAVEATAEFLQKQTKLVYIELNKNICVNSEFGGYLELLIDIRSNLELCHKNFDSLSRII